MLVQLAQVAIQLLLMIYIEKVFPGDFGIPEKFYFPLMPCYKLLKRRLGYNSLENQDAVLQQRRISGADFEEEPLSMRAGIRISNLSKSFDNKLAVDKMNLNMYEGQITVLLGHNGAGKSTLMNVITGEDVNFTSVSCPITSFLSF